MTSSPPGRTILVRLPNPLGDVVMATPLLRALRDGLPEARIVAAGRRAHGPLLEGLDSMDAFVDAGGGIARHGETARGGRGRWRARAAVLREAGADVALLLPNSWSTALAAWRAGIPRRVGRRHQGRAILLTDRLPPIAGPASMDALYLDFLAPLGLPHAAPPVELQVTREVGLELPQGTPLIGVAPGAAFGPSKRYPNELLAEALACVHQEHGLVPLLLGSPSERELLADLDARLRIPHVSTHARPGDLGDAKALIARCTVLLAADNGARHLAAALGVPQVVWFGPTHPAWSGYAGSGTRSLRRDDLDCIACHCRRCPLPGHPCMRGIAPAEVAAAVGAAFRGAPGSTKAAGAGGTGAAAGGPG